MGRYVKNTQANAGTTAIRVPQGTTAQRPEHPVHGQVRYNETTHNMEFYANNQWTEYTIGGTITLKKDTFTGNGVDTVFGPMYRAVTDPLDVLVFVGNIFQNPGVAYITNGTANIVFTAPVPAGHTIVIIHGLNSTVTI